MNRRTFLTGITVCCAGCLDTDGEPASSPTDTSSTTEATTPSPSPTDTASPTPEPTHPLADEYHTIRVLDDSDTDLDIHEIAAEAVEWWNQNGEEYVGFEISLGILDDRAADFELVFVDGVRTCGGVSADILGCAPLLRAGDELHERNTTIEVVGADRPRGRVLTTTKHELGHVLGLDHDAEPAEIMSDDPHDRIPEYETRLEIWGRQADVRETQAEAIETNNEATEHWNRENHSEAAETFEKAKKIYEDGVALVSESGDDLDELLDLDEDETLHTDRLETLLGDALEWFELRADYAAYMAEAANDLDSGRRSSASRAFDDAQDAREESNEHRVATVNEIGVAVGLDDPLVD